MRRFGFFGAALAAVVALLLAGCSSDSEDAKPKSGDRAEAADGGSDDATSTTSTTEPESKGSSGGAAAYVEAVATSMRADGEMPLDDDQVKCFSARYVDIVGVDRFESAGLTPEMIAADNDGSFEELGLSEAEGNELYDAFGGCGIDLRGLMLSSVAEEDEEMAPEVIACMEQVFDEDTFRAFMVTSMIHGDDAMETDPEMAEVMSGLMACSFMAMGES